MDVTALVLREMEKSLGERPSDRWGSKNVVTVFRHQVWVFPLSCASFGSWNLFRVGFNSGFCEMVLECIQMRSDQNPGWLFYIEDYNTTQLYRDHMGS